MEFNLDTTISELHSSGMISVRTYNCLTHEEIHTLGDVIDRYESPIDMLKIKNFGRKSYTEIVDVLSTTNRNRIEPEEEGFAETPKTKQQIMEEQFAALGEKIDEIIVAAHVMVTEGDGDVCSYLKAQYPHAYELNNVVTYEPEKMLEIVEGFTRDENLDIRHSYKRFMDQIIERLEEEHLAEENIYAVYKRSSLSLSLKMENFSYEQIAKYLLSPIAQEYIEKVYQEQRKMVLGVRANNFSNTFLPHFADLIKYADKPLGAYRDICPGRSMMKTLTEIFHFNQKFKKIFDRLSKLSDDEIQTEFLKRDYPYLVSRQRMFVFDFIKENNHAPLFYLMLQYLRLSENRSNKIYSLYHGIADGKKRTLNEIAEAMSLTRERVRQIACGTIEIQGSALVNNDGWEYYKDFLELPYIYEDKMEYVSLKENEHLAADFGTFAYLLNLVADFKIEEINDRVILLNRNKMSELNLADCIDTFNSIVNAKYSTDTYVPLDSILFTVPEEVRPVTKRLIKYIATEIYELKLTEDEQIILSQNYIDISEELYDILEKKGEPMHVDDIFKAFKERYPDHKYTEPIQIKSYLSKNQHIRAVGKTSKYALDSWEGVYFGSIRDLLIDQLTASDEPLHIYVLYDGVAEYYPNTSKSSVAATMEDEDLQRFVKFEGDYFGLTSKQYSDKYQVATTVQRYKFDDRFQMFKDFVDAYHRFPNYNGSEQEASLMRWLYNVTTGVLSASDEQMSALNEQLKQYDDLGYPRTATEWDFLTKCNDVKEYINKHHTPPTNSNAPELYYWFRRSRDNYDSYIDKRRRYMTDLMNWVLSLGFSI